MPIGNVSENCEVLEAFSLVVELLTYSLEVSLVQAEEQLPLLLVEPHQRLLALRSQQGIIITIVIQEQPSFLIIYPLFFLLLE
jgi:hypothetical protein